KITDTDLAIACKRSSVQRRNSIHKLAMPFSPSLLTCRKALICCTRRKQSRLDGKAIYGYVVHFLCFTPKKFRVVDVATPIVEHRNLVINTFRVHLSAKAVSGVALLFVFSLFEVCSRR